MESKIETDDVSDLTVLSEVTAAHAVLDESNVRTNDSRVMQSE
jgi:hypothetical protein